MDVHVDLLGLLRTLLVFEYLCMIGCWIISSARHGVGSADDTHREPEHYAGWLSGC